MTYELEMQFAAAGTGLIQITPTQDPEITYNFSGISSPNTGGARQDQLFQQGWNVGINGLPADPTQASIGMSFESYWNPDAQHIWKEWYIQYFAPNSVTSIRPFSVGVNQVSGIVAGQLQADTMGWLNGAGVEIGGWNCTSGPQFFMLASGNFAQVLQFTNTADPTYQWRWQIPNATGSASRAGSLELLYHDGTPLQSWRQDKTIGIGYGNDAPPAGTLDVCDATPTTGATTLRVRAGAGQGTANLFEVKDAAGNVVFAVNSTGIVVQ